MYTYKHHPMSKRDVLTAEIGLTIRAMVKFHKILSMRVQECDNSKWRGILKEVGDKVAEAFHVRCDLKCIMQYTKELETMDVGLFLPKPKLQPTPAALDYQQRRQLEKDHMLGHPTGDRVFSLRRRHNNRKPEREKYQYQLQVA